MQVQLQLYHKGYIKSNLKLLLDEENYQLLSVLPVAFIVIVFTIVAVFIISRHFQKIKHKENQEEQWHSREQTKARKLKTHALQLAKRNEFLKDIKEQVSELKKEYHTDKRHQRIINQIKAGLNNDNNWSLFSSYFNEIYEGFSEKARRSYPEISENELRLMLLLKMNLSSRAIGSILNISHEGVKKARYRLRKKMRLKTSDSLEYNIDVI